MDERIVSRGFRGRRPGRAERLPPGQYETRDFPVLSAGPTPRTSPDAWDFAIVSPTGTTTHWDLLAFRALPRERITKDIHCVTKWSRLDTHWEGVSVDTLLDAAGNPPARFVLAFCDGGYTTNLPFADITGGRAWIVDTFDDAPLHPEHGGPARLLVPHLYFWKSAKWVRGLRLLDEDVPGFWEDAGYHMRGDPWREQRYLGDE
jgi:DMSO/TMAO reductase YedYZ molybdopterin-dependent catalytic subunit